MLQKVHELNEKYGYPGGCLSSCPWKAVVDETWEDQYLVRYKVLGKDLIYYLPKDLDIKDYEKRLRENAIKKCKQDIEDLENKIKDLQKKLETYEKETT